MNVVPFLEKEQYHMNNLVLLQHFTLSHGIMIILKLIKSNLIPVLKCTYI